MRFRKETNAKKTIRKWLALVLVVAIVASSGIYALDHALQAHDGEGEYSEDIGEASALQEIDLGASEDSEPSQPEDTESSVPEVTETESSVPETEDSETDAPEDAEPVNSEPGQPEDGDGENVEPEENEGKPQNSKGIQNLRAPPSRPGRPGQSTPTPKPTNYTYYFRNDTTSAGVTIYYSKNGSTDLIPIANGQRIGFSGSEIKGIMFYVKVEEGYELEKISFPTGNQVGEFSNIGSTGSLAGVSFGNANRAAQNMGCIKEFHYSEFNPSSHAGVDLVRSFKVNAKTIGGQSTEVTRIIYHSNDGRNATKGQSVDQNSNATLLGDGAFERDGYTLIGWSTEADDTAEYGLGASYQVGTSEVDLYAVWQEASQPTPTPTAGPTSSPDPEEGGSPTPTPTVGPTSSPDPEDGGSPTPTATATATPTPTPTPTPVPEPKDITVTIYENGYYVEDAAYAGNHTYVYDGTDKTASGYVWTASDESYTQNDFKYIGDASKLTVTAKEEGTYAMELTAADFENTNTAGFNVTFVIVDGGFEISKTKVVLTAANATKVYDGAPLTADGVTAQGLPEDYTVEATMTADSTITNVGEVLNTIESYVIKNAEGADVTSIYSVTTQPGLLTVTKKPVTLVSQSATKQYDGNPLFASAVTGADGFVAGDVTRCFATGSVTYPFEGKVTNTIEITWADADKAANYEITKNEGTLEITDRTNKYRIALEANSAVYTYDGDEKTVSGFVTTTFERNGNTYVVENISASAAATDVSVDEESNVQSYPVTPVEGTGGLKVLHVKNGNKVDVTDQFTVTVTGGSLAILPRTVLMRSDSATDLYDSDYRDGNKVLSAPNVDDTHEDYDGFIDGEGVTYSNFTTLDTIGSVPNEFEYTENSGTNITNYEIYIENGFLTLAENADQIIVRIRGNSATYGYDGQPHTASGYVVEEIIDLADSGYTQNDFALKSGVSTSVTETDAGTYPIGLSADSFENLNANYSNVTFLVADGKLTINPVAVIVTITGNSDEVKYNGSLQSVTGYTVQANVASYAESNIAFDGTAEASGVDAGTYEMGLTADDFSNTNGNYTVQFVVIDGELDIARREVTLTSDSASQVFNGQPLSAPNVTAGGDGFVGEEGVTYSGFPTLTPVGQISNTFNWEFLEDTNPENYIVNAYYGTLTVTPVPAPVVDDEELYTLTIYYVNNEGEQVALPHVEELPEGAQFSIASPVIEGYTPDIATVSSTGMPARNVTITVTYTPVDGGDPEDPEDPDDPAGPVDPDDPDDPADPADPDDPAIPAIPAVAPDEPTEPAFEPELPELPEDEPADIMIVADDEGEPELVVIEDEETPLAGGLLEALHSCCILHFLILLAAMLVLAWYTKDMKKRQAKIFELKEQLEGDIDVE